MIRYFIVFLHGLTDSHSAMQQNWKSGLSELRRPNNITVYLFTDSVPGLWHHQLSLPVPDMWKKTWWFVFVLHYGQPSSTITPRAPSVWYHHNLRWPVLACPTSPRCFLVLSTSSSLWEVNYTSGDSICQPTGERNVLARDEPILLYLLNLQSSRVPRPAKGRCRKKSAVWDSKSKEKATVYFSYIVCLWVYSGCLKTSWGLLLQKPQSPTESHGREEIEGERFKVCQGGKLSDGEWEWKTASGRFRRKRNPNFQNAFRARDLAVESELCAAFSSVALCLRPPATRGAAGPGRCAVTRKCSEATVLHFISGSLQRGWKVTFSVTLNHLRSAL